MNEPLDRLEILRQVERGELTPQEAARLLGLADDPTRLETPQDEAATLMSQETPPPWPEAPEPAADTTPPSAGDDFELGRFKFWRWLSALPFWFSVALTAMSAYWMYQGWQAARFGWGFFLSWIPLLLGVLGILLFWQTRWLHLRVRQGQGKRPEVIRISLPLPLTAGAWFLRSFSGVLPADLRDKHLDEMVEGLGKSVSKDDPIHIYVDDEEDGDQVEIYIG
ncbi:MAG TPA: hypothetical protein PKG95_01710 [Anaerolineaceae bacterium]|nr:hypothetical protein [Anaerolineaceae bacterium]